jgi:hypothetical protein
VTGRPRVQAGLSTERVCTPGTRYGHSPYRPGGWETWQWTSEQWGGRVLVRQGIPDGAGRGMADKIAVRTTGVRG